MRRILARRTEWPPWWERPPMDARCLLAIAGAVVLANLLYLTGIFDPNPLATRSGLGRNVLAGILPGQPTIDPNVGFISQALGHRGVLDLLHLQLPWWNPYEGTGFPLAGEVGAAALFPPTLLTWFANGQLYEHMLLEMLAGGSTYLLLRRIELGRVASLAGGIAFALNGTAAWFAHLAVNPVAFLPLLLLGLELAHNAALEGRRGGWWLLALAGALSLYAGFPEVAYLDALLGAVWFLWRCGTLGRARAGAFLVKVATGTVVGALLCAPLLIALLDYTAHADLGRHASGFFAHVHIPLQTMPQLVMPYVFGPIFAFSDPKLVVFAGWANVGGFLSSSLLLLALLGVASRGRRGLRVLLGLWVVVLLARTYDTPAFVADLVNLVPGLSNVAVFRYDWPSIELAVVVLAAIGLDGLVRAAHPRRVVIGVGVLSLVLLGIAAGVAWPLVDKLGGGPGHRAPFAGSLAWAMVVVLALVCCGLLVSQVRRRSLLALAIVAADALLLFAIPELSAPRSAGLDTAPVSYLERHLGSGRYFTLGPLAPNYGSYFGLASLNANDLPIPSAFAAYVHRRLDHFVDPTMFVGNYGGSRSPFLPSPEHELLANLAGYREAGVSYVLTPAGQALPQSTSTFALVDRTPSTWIYRLAGTARYMTSSPPGCTIVLAGRTTAHVTCPGPAMLIRRETYLPGWRATIDGRPTPVHSVNGLFQAVRLPAGAHEVRFSFSPPGVGWGAVCLLLGVAALLIPGGTASTAARRAAAWRRSSRPRPA